MRHLLILTLCLLAAGCSDDARDANPAPAGEADRAAVDLILRNGHILTLDDGNRIADVMVVHDGRIVAVGGEALTGRYSAAHRHATG